MRLENLPNQGVTDSGRASVTRTAGPEIASTGHMALPTGNSDQVSLSGASSLLSLANSLSSDRQTRIQALTAQYSAGTYRPDVVATSRSIIESLKS